MKINNIKGKIALGLVGIFFLLGYLISLDLGVWMILGYAMTTAITGLLIKKVREKFN
ncbi:MAG: hypothetical protein LBI43_07100 [Streptococcaceae bacterium]|jgi:hypothetical protein|nr:hypothetical protein [Streptococcaceae bacterium]